MNAVTSIICVYIYIIRTSIRVFVFVIQTESRKLEKREKMYNGDCVVNIRFSRTSLPFLKLQQKNTYLKKKCQRRWWFIPLFWYVMTGKQFKLWILCNVHDGQHLTLFSTTFVNYYLFHFRISQYDIYTFCLFFLKKKSSDDELFHICRSLSNTCK